MTTPTWGAPEPTAHRTLNDLARDVGQATTLGELIESLQRLEVATRDAATDMETSSDMIYDKWRLAGSDGAGHARMARRLLMQATASLTDAADDVRALRVAADRIRAKAREEQGRGYSTTV